MTRPRTVTLNAPDGASPPTVADIYRLEAYVHTGALRPQTRVLAEATTEDGFAMWSHSDRLPSLAAAARYLTALAANPDAPFTEAVAAAHRAALETETP